jgi:predicted amidohydrolase
MKVALVNYNIEWNNPEQNLTNLDVLIEKLVSFSDTKPDLIVLPEFFTTGFAVENIKWEPDSGRTQNWLSRVSNKYDIAILASIAVKEGRSLYNRAFFVYQEIIERYDKRHLFSFGGENLKFTAGDKQTIVNFKGFNIAIQICYDLRFPVWSRNKNLSYDLLINIANWPSAREAVIEPLCRARAIENICYFSFVNRKGSDKDSNYSGQRYMIDYTGNHIQPFNETSEYAVFEINRPDLENFRERFPVWKDADKFLIE